MKDSDSQQIEELEDGLASLVLQEEVLSQEEVSVKKKLLRLKEEQQLRTQPLRQALKEAKASVQHLLQEQRRHRETHEAQRRLWEEQKEEREEQRDKEVQERQRRNHELAGVHQGQREQVQVQVQTLDQDLLSQTEKHEAERRKRKEEHEAIKALRIESQQKQLCERLQMQLQQQLEQETQQHEDTMSQVEEILKQIQTVRISRKAVCRETKIEAVALRLEESKVSHLRTLNRYEREKNQILQKSTEQLKKQRVSLLQERERSLKLAERQRHTLRQKFVEKQHKDQESQSLQEELKKEATQRRRQEARVCRVLELLDHLLQTEPSSCETQQLQNLLRTCSEEVSLTDLSFYSLQQYRGGRASDHSLREESESLEDALTDPEFLLNRVRPPPAPPLSL